MLMDNVWLKTGLVNGSIGIVQDLMFESSQDYIDSPSIAIIDFPQYCGPSYYPEHPTWVPISQLQNGALPLTLAYAFTIHKAQGSTLGKVTVDIGNEFSLGITYVAYSRVKRLSDLRLNREYDFSRLSDLT
jgi:ATP-dependent DNA helicase PIF1